MSELRGYGAAYTVLARVRDAIVAEYLTRNVVPTRYGVVPGAIAWDGCETCGQLALSKSRDFLTNQFPIEVTSTDLGPGGLLGFDLVTQTIRCVPMPDDRGNPPLMVDLDESAQLIINDGYSQLCATITTLEQMKNQLEIVDYLIRQQLYPGPEGGCAGAELIFTVAVEL